MPIRHNYVTEEVETTNNDELKNTGGIKPDVANDITKITRHILPNDHDEFYKQTVPDDLQEDTSAELRKNVEGVAEASQTSGPDPHKSILESVDVSSIVEHLELAPRNEAAGPEPNESILRDIARITESFGPEPHEGPEPSMFSEADIIDEAALDKGVAIFGCVMETLYEDKDAFNAILKDVNEEVVMESAVDESVSISDNIRFFKEAMEIIHENSEIKNKSDMNKLIDKVGKMKDAPSLFLKIMAGMSVVFGIALSLPLAISGGNAAAKVAGDMTARTGLLSKTMFKLGGIFGGVTFGAGIIGAITANFVIWVSTKILNWFTKSDYCTPTQKDAAFKKAFAEIDKCITKATKAGKKDQVKTLKSGKEKLESKYRTWKETTTAGNMSK